MELKELIKIVEERRNNMFYEYKRKILFKKQLKIYLNRYDELLYDLYTKYSIK